MYVSRKDNIKLIKKTSFNIIALDLLSFFSLFLSARVWLRLFQWSILQKLPHWETVSRNGGRRKRRWQQHSGEWSLLFLIAGVFIMKMRFHSITYLAQWQSLSLMWQRALNMRYSSSLAHPNRHYQTNKYPASHTPTREGDMRKMYSCRREEACQAVPIDTFCGREPGSGLYKVLGC